MSQTYHSESDTVCLYFRHLQAQEGTELSTGYKIHAKESQQDSAAYVSRPCPLNPPLYVRQPVWTSCCENVTKPEEGSWGGGGGGEGSGGGGSKERGRGKKQTDRQTDWHTKADLKTGRYWKDGGLHALLNHYTISSSLLILSAIQGY